MRTTPAKTAEKFAKRAKLFDEMVVRAEVRRARALALGNQREADGAMKTIKDSRASARRLRALLRSMTSCSTHSAPQTLSADFGPQKALA